MYAGFSDELGIGSGGDAGEERDTDMTLTNYWWLLIWLFVAGGILTIAVPKRPERVLGKTENRWSWGAAIMLACPYAIWCMNRSWFGDISNYSINLIDANKIDNLKRFHTGLQEILGVLQCRGDKEKLLEYINERADYFQNVDEETYHFMRVALHSGRLLKETVERNKGEDGVNMCKALEDLYNDGVECE